MPSQTKQSEAELSCLGDPTFDESVYEEVGKTVGMTVVKA